MYVVNLCTVLCNYVVGKNTGKFDKSISISQYFTYQEFPSDALSTIIVT